MSKRRNNWTTLFKSARSTGATIDPIFNGMSDALEGCMKDVATDMAMGVEEWSAYTEEMMFEAAPYATGNLRDAIDYETEQDGPFNIASVVGVNRDELLKNTPRDDVVRNPDNPWRGYEVTIPHRDYVMEADEHNVTANYGAGGPFVESVWYEGAKRIAKEVV